MSFLSSIGSGLSLKNIEGAVGLKGVKPLVSHVEDNLGLHGFNGLGKGAGTGLGEAAIALGAMSGADLFAGAGAATEGTAAAGGGTSWLGSLFSGTGAAGAGTAGTGTAAAGSSNSLWGPVLGALTTTALGGNKSSGAAASAADPFASQRGGYQALLAQMMAPGGFNASDPSYQFRFNQGEQALERSAGAKGLLNSGNRLIALSDYGQNTASTEYQNQFQRLATLAGATSGSPATAGSIIAGQQTGQQQAYTAFGNLVGNKLAGWLNAPAESTTPEIYNT